MATRAGGGGVAEKFTLEVNISNPGDTIVIGSETGGGRSTDYNVDWGDGNSDSNVTADATHTYAAAGTYEIKIDGTNINDIDIASLRSNIGLVNQEIFLFDGTIRENICYPNTDIDDSLLMEVAQSSQCLEFIEKLDDGFDTIVGERDQKLSVGQKQRIGLARALLRKPSILIFDEITANLDKQTETEIVKNLSFLKKRINYLKETVFILL